ncbi:MAG: PocR ligand-binding domain-containing protein [Desulfuromonadaceae bacterium]|nr:PocR ligand-binding domain-containing protein [Desulfuromonadaceae bacterium]MDD2847274.1 PocR ligand-binding domain-containing protein [Desulfuromonadaceae bacterium]MDD4130218.1 PocR ligand-binding domain-containing protein [Desulfuromonadaceae bacterium]
MNYTLKDIIDVPKLRDLLDVMDEMYGVPSAVVDRDGAVLIAGAWQDICARFHRTHAETEKLCIECNVKMGSAVGKETSQTLYHCPLGLVYFASGIFIEGKHVGSIISNQLFLTPPDEAHFSRQALRYGFDKDEYLAAVRSVPVLSEDKLSRELVVLKSLVQMLAEQGLQYKRQREAEESLRKSESALSSLQETLQEQYEELQLNEESLRDQNDELMATEEMLRAQILEHEASQKLLRESFEIITREKETAQRYLDIAGVMFCALNRSGEIILMNKKGAQILGYGDGELLGRNWFDVCLPEEVREKVKAVFALQLIGNLAPVEFYENSVINRKGEKRLIAFHNTLLHDDEGICGVLFSGEDITVQRMTEDERLKALKLESLGVLAGGIAHDFNNLLTGIMGNISMAQSYLDDTHKSCKSLERAEAASVRAAELAHQLLTFARGGEPVKKVVSLRNIADESVSFALHGSKIKGYVDVPETISAIEADEGQISQVFNNIIINAVQAMPDGGNIKITAHNEQLDGNGNVPLPAGMYVRLVFEDEGCGIADDTLKRIFDPYFTTKSSGNGLGLASVYSIVARHGGHIGVASVIGKGTVFTVYLPSIGATYEHYQHRSAAQSCCVHEGGAVLVMDDEDIIRDMTAEMLRALGYQATTVASGAEAIAVYKAASESAEPFMVVIMDLTIPGGMGGKETAEQILAINPNACLVVSSGYSNDPIMSDYGNHGFVGALAKPYKLPDLMTLLASLNKGQCAMV